jgi:N,N-dimethylformamidase
MTDHSRRDFLKTAGLGVTGLSALDRARSTVWAVEDVPESAAIPPHRPMDVPGVHAYPRAHSIAAGEELGLCVSASVPYRLSICRLGHQVDDPVGDEVLAAFPEQPARPLPIHPGSYVHIEGRLDGPIEGLTIECWVRPWSLVGFAGLVSQYDYPSACGVGLFLAPGGKVSFYPGDGGSYDAVRALESPPDALSRGKWHHVVAAWDGREAALFIDGKEVARGERPGPLAWGPAPLRLAASGERGLAAHALDGDLAMPTILGRAPHAAEVAARFADRGRSMPSGDRVLACWPLDEERGDRVADGSGHRRHGRIINHATWMIGGPSFDSDVPRFGTHDPATDPDRGHGLRFASDDLYDCRWPVAHRWAVPEDARPGVYVARIDFDFEGTPRQSHVSFLVRRPPSRPKAPILVLAATNTWRAYGGTPFAVTPPDRMQVWGTGGLPGAAAGLPSFDLYRTHAAGQGTYQIGLHMPWPAAGPYVLYGGPTSYSHLMRAERFLHVWLEQNGYEYDLISDVDLHRDPSVLDGYRVVIINGHNEYWSLPMYRGVESYLATDGRLVVLSGNTMFWRVSFDDACSVMECRKVDAPGEQLPHERRGEAWHSHDGLRGGMLRECGFPGWKLIGLDTLGWNNQANPKNFGPYIAERADHPFFRSPEDTGLQPGDRFGWAGAETMPMANGHEFDVRPSTLAALQEQPDPEGISVPPDPAGMERLANGVIPWSEGGAAFDYFFRRIKPENEQGGEMIDWPRPDGGRVFNAGAIGSGWVLSADERWGAMLRNVLHHFGVSRPSR